MAEPGIERGCAHSTDARSISVTAAGKTAIDPTAAVECKKARLIEPGFFFSGLLRRKDYFQPFRSNQAFITQPPTKGTAQFAVEMNTSRVVSGRFTISVPTIGDKAAQPMAEAP